MERLDEKLTERRGEYLGMRMKNSQMTVCCTGVDK